MSRSLEKLLEEYTSALEAYLQGGGEESLDCAYEIGRAAVEARLGVLDVTRIHQDALEAILTRLPERKGSARRVKRAYDILNEALGPFEMTQRGYLETLEQLREFNRRLEQQVDERTRELRETEAKYRSLFEHNPLPMWVYDLETLAFLAVNDAAVQHYGYGRDEFQAMTIKDIRPEEDVPALLDNLSATPQAIEKSGPWRHRKKNGTLIDVEIKSYKISFGGRPARLVLANDITARLQRERELQAIATVSTALRAAPTRAEIPPVILDQLLVLLQVDAAALAMRDPVSGETVIELAHGAWTGSTGERIPPGEGVSGQVIASGKPYLNNDVRTDPQYIQLGLNDDLRAVACVPLSAQQQTTGALWVARKRHITGAEVRLLTTVSDIAANAIHRAALHEKTEQRLERIAALHTIDLAISSSFDLHLTLKIFLEQVTQQLGVDAADVLLLNPHIHRLEYSAGHGFRTDAMAGVDLRLDECPAGRAALERRIVSIANLAKSDFPFMRAKALVGEEFIAYHGVPLIAKGQVKGVLEIFHRKPMNPDPEWLDFLETLAGQAAVAINDAAMFNDLQRSNLELTLAYDATIEGWSRALDLRDKETEGHTQRVTEMTERLARRLALSDAEIVHVHRGALLHDIGKMGVPDTILLKPGPLTDEEWVIMRKHPVYAFEMLHPISYLRPALDIPYCHHEKWDGTGYPRGLEGEQIPLAARIFAVVDVWDALRSDRPYRAPWPEDDVLAYIRAEAGKHFDPQLVEAFLGEVERTT
ncbi:MAG TPA: HD domain-containing phosphohydrolase [Anaerolineales bacterium]